MSRTSNVFLLLAWPAISTLAQETPGCFFYPYAAPSILNPYGHAIYRYHDPKLTAPSATVATAGECQKLCAAQTNCSVFTFFDNTDACWLQSSDSSLNTTVGDYFGPATVAGPKVCPEVPDRCSPQAIPKPGFPDTEQLAFPKNFQPKKNVCWNGTRSGYDFRLSACTDTIKVAQYVTKCAFPKQLPTPKSWLTTTGTTCRQLCERNPECATYETLPSGDCFTGVGVNCTVLPDSTNSSGARLVRGSLRTIFSWAKIKFVAGMVLRQTFLQEQQFRKVFQTSSFTSTAEAQKACRDACYSYLNCEYWQLTTQACFIDTSDSFYELAYPLSKDNFKLNADDVIAGEYVQHLCGVPLVYPSKGVMAHITIEAQNLDYNQIALPKRAELSSAFAEKIAIWLSVPKDYVQAMDGSKAGVTIAAVPWSLSSANVKSRRLQVGGLASAISTFLDAHIKVPDGLTIDQILAKFPDNTKLFSDLQAATLSVLGMGSPAIFPGLQFVGRQERVVPIVPTWQDTSGQASESGSGMPWWVWLLLAIGVLLVVACIAGFLLGACDEEKKKKKSFKSSSRKKDRDAEDPRDTLVDAPAVQPVPTVVEPVPMYTSGAAYQQGVVTAAQPVRQVQMIAGPVYR